MKKFKKLTSLALAGLMVTSQFAVSVYADAPTNKKVTLLYDDFASYEYVPTQGATNDGLSNWRIESGNNEDLNKDSENPHVIAEDLVVNGVKKMDKALHIKGITSGFSSNVIRGGRLFTDDTIVGAGETVLVEFDVYAFDDTSMEVGLANHTRGSVEDGLGNNLFALRAGNDNIFTGSSQSSWVDVNDGNAKTGLTIKKNEVNHVKVEYSFNKDASKFDTMTITVKDSDDNITSVTKQRNCRNAAMGNSMYAAKGIAISQAVAGGDIWIDNLEAYKYETENGYNYLTEDFTGKTFADLTHSTNQYYSDNDGLYTWRIETENNQTQDTEKNKFISVEDFDGGDGDSLYDALKIAPTAGLTFPENAGSKTVRGGIKWEGKIGTCGWGGTWDERYVINVEMDIVPELTTNLDIKMHTDKDTAADHPYAGSLFHIKDGELYVNGVAGNAYDSLKKMEDITLVMGEVNHIKAQYAIHPNGNADSGDTVKITVTNSAKDGQPQTAKNGWVNHKTVNYIFTKVDGIGFFKFDATSTVYIDNIIAYKEPAEVKAPTVTAVDKSTATNGTSDITVTFDKAMLESTLSNIVVIQNGIIVSKSGTLSEDGKTYTITSDYQIGVEARVLIPRSVKAADGIPVEAFSETLYTPTTVENKIMLGNNTWDLPTSNAKVDKNHAVNIYCAAKSELDGHTLLYCVAGYDSSNKLVSVKTKTGTANQKFNCKATITAGEGESFKVFVWDVTDGKPLGANL